MNKFELGNRLAGKAVVESEGGILILKPSEIDTNKNWHIPGGIKDEPSESIKDTATRELFEETQIDQRGKDIGDPIYESSWNATDKGEKVTIVASFFHIIIAERPIIVLSDEHVNFAWVNTENIANYSVNNEVRELVSKLLNK